MRRSKKMSNLLFSFGESLDNEIDILVRTLGWDLIDGVSQILDKFKLHTYDYRKDITKEVLMRLMVERW